MSGNRIHFNTLICHYFTVYFRQKLMKLPGKLHNTAALPRNINYYAQNKKV